VQRVLEGRQDTGPLALTLSVIAGDGQSAPSGTPFAMPLGVEVRQSNGQPAAGIAVTHASLGGAADVQFEGGDTQITVQTGSDGRASAVAQAAGVAGSAGSKPRSRASTRQA
jgi:hypothetical protein